MAEELITRRSPFILVLENKAGERLSIPITIGEALLDDAKTVERRLRYRLERYAGLPAVDVESFREPLRDRLRRLLADRCPEQLDRDVQGEVNWREPLLNEDPA